MEVEFVVCLQTGLNGFGILRVCGIDFRVFKNTKLGPFSRKIKFTDFFVKFWPFFWIFQNFFFSIFDLASELRTWASGVLWTKREVLSKQIFRKKIFFQKKSWKMAKIWQFFQKTKKIRKQILEKISRLVYKTPGLWSRIRQIIKKKIFFEKFKKMTKIWRKNQ